MNALQIKSNPELKKTFQKYPEKPRKKIEHLRRLILETAEALEDIHELEETLKWGEPSFLVKKGSTIRIDWKEKKPDQYAMYFKCTSKLVPSFKWAFGNLFNYEGDRAIVFQMDEKIPEKELKKCIAAGLRYHKLKHLPNLGL